MPGGTRESLGAHERALEMLQVAYDGYDTFLNNASRDFRFEALRRDPHRAAILARIERLP